MMGVGGASAAYGRPTRTTRQSHKSQLNSAVHKRKMSKQQILKWGADTVIKFLVIYNSYEVLWDASHENYFRKNARGHNLGKLFLELQNAGPEFQIPNEETLKGKIKSIKTVTELNSKKLNDQKKNKNYPISYPLSFLFKIKFSYNPLTNFDIC